jgi:hypothetical protein
LIRCSRPCHPRSRRANPWTVAVEVFGSGPLDGVRAL